MRLGPSVTTTLRELVDRSGCLQTEDRRSNTEDRRPKNALLDAKTLNSMGSSFCSFTRPKLQNEDPL